MKLFFRSFGSGPILIILHGLYGSSDNWVSIARKLSGRFTVILPDLRNHGHSPHSGIHDYDSMADDILELAESLNQGKFILAGHSMGGKVAMRFAIRWPEKLAGLAIFDISPFGAAEKDNKTGKLHRRILESIISTDPSGYGTRSSVEEIMRIKILDERITSLLMKNLSRTSEGAFYWRLNANALLGNLENIMAGVVEKEDFNSPPTGFRVVFLRGSRSEYIAGDELPSIRRVFPAAELIEIEDAGHWIHADRPDAVERCLLEFLG